MKIYGARQAPNDTDRWFWFDEKGGAHAYKFDDDNGHEKDDTQYIEGSEEIYINGYYIKKEDWVEVKEVC